jgi:hypothetical protein
VERTNYSPFAIRQILNDLANKLEDQASDAALAQLVRENADHIVASYEAKRRQADADDESKQGVYPLI